MSGNELLKYLMDKDEITIRELHEWTGVHKDTIRHNMRNEKKIQRRTAEKYAEAFYKYTVDDFLKEPDSYLKVLVDKFIDKYKINYKTFANLVKIELLTLHKHMEGSMMPSHVTLRRYADVLEVDYNKLFEEMRDL